LAYLNKRKLSLWLKVAVVLLAYYFIYQSVSNKTELAHFVLLVKQLPGNQVALTFVLLVLLMLLNWLLEALKWRYIVRNLARLSVWQAVEGVFCGLTWAIFTPNRLGEYGGRVLLLPPRKRVYGVFVMGIDQLGQNVVTCAVGTTAFLWLLYNYLHPAWWLALLLTLALITFALFMLTCYFNISWLMGLLGRIKWLQKHQRFFNVVAAYDKRRLWGVMLFCISRFAVFSSQYYLVIHLLLPRLQGLGMMMMVFNNFFAQTILPTLDVLDVGLRGLTAATFFSYITNQKIAIIAAVSSIWFINLIVPAVLGSVFVLKIKFFGNRD
jgi:hypothetical protein